MAGSQIHNRQRIQHTARADIATGLAAAVWPPDQQATGSQRGKVMLRCRVAVHLLVHGGYHGDRGRSGQADGGHQVVGHAGCDTGDEIGGGRREDD